MRVRALSEADFGVAIPFMNEAAPEHPLDESELRLWFDNPVGDVESAVVDGEFWHRGIRSVGLGVDGESETGAVRPYEKAGMRVERRFETFGRRLA